jgi:hypothetical protein
LRGGSFSWRVIFIVVCLLGVAGMLWLGPFPDRQARQLLVMSDHVVHWMAIGLYLAIAVLAFTPLHTLRIEGVLLTALILLGVQVALRLMFAVGHPPTATASRRSRRCVRWPQIRPLAVSGCFNWTNGWPTVGV